MESLERLEDEKSLEGRKEEEALVPVSGERVSNAWVICLEEGNNCPKGLVIPHKIHI